MRIVIVGGAGFIGTALARAMSAAGWKPLVADTERRLARSAHLRIGIDVVPFDFTNHDASRIVGGADGVVHLACTSHPANSMQHIAQDAESNIAPSVRLFEAASAAGVRRVVFASSGGTVYGAPTRLPVSEADATLPLSAYGVSKLAVERYLSLFPALQGVSLRVANPYGPYQLSGSSVGVLARYAAQVANGEKPVVWGDGSVIRDFIAIEDVADAFIEALEAEDLQAGVYNVGSGRGASINEVLMVLQSIAGRRIEVTYEPARPYDVPAVILDSSKFSVATGWHSRTELHDGMAALYAVARGSKP